MKREVVTCDYCARECHAQDRYLILDRNEYVALGRNVIECAAAYWPLHFCTLLCLSLWSEQAHRKSVRTVMQDING